MSRNRHSQDTADVMIVLFIVGLIIIAGIALGEKIVQLLQ